MDKSTDKYIGMMLGDRYEILELIGAGGMANVYKALCHRLNRYDAVKIMRDDAAANESLRNSFRAESQAVAMLSHPNIVSVYDVSHNDDLEYIVMELIDGITLKDYLKANGPVKPEQAVNFSIQIARALSHAHSKGIIHRDIKPQNVMLLDDGLIKVADFGIAALQSDENGESNETVGSVHYIAPEQARGGAADLRSDIYSLGIVMYEMLTGRLPYVGRTELEVAVKHMNTDAVAPTDIIPELPKELERICLKAMETDINKRYQSADELLKELEKVRKQILKEEHKVKHISSKEIHSDEDTEDARELSAKKKKKKHALSSGIIAVLILIILAFLFAIGYFVKDLYFSTEPVEIPSFVGRYVEDVVNDESYNEQFRFTVSFKVDEEHESGIIIEQSPTGGVKRTQENKDEKIEIKLTISSGETEGKDSQEPKVVPDVVNKTSAEAINRLNAEGFVCKTVDAASPSVSRGYVISTEPAAGETAENGTEIVVTVSTGPETELETVPQLVGLSKSAAISKLEKSGLSVGSIEPVDSEYDAGTVIWQSIEPYETVEVRTKIDIQISAGPSGGER